MSKDYLFFISHNSKDNLLAQQLYDMLLEGHPEWAGQIFLDCSREKPLETKEEWQNAMMKAVEDSRHLIFVTSDVAHLKEGNGWVYEEVNTFKNRKATRHRDGRAHKNISYTGIFLCDCNFERDLYADASYGSTYRTLYNAPEHLVLGKHASLEDARTRILKKAAAMVDGTDVDDVSLEILERVQKFRDERISRGVMSAEQDINDALLPPITVLSELNEETARAIGVLREDHSSGTQEEEGSGSTNFFKTNAKLSFHQLCKLVYAANIQLLGREGGCGKTTLLTKLFHHQLHLCEEDPSLHAIPLYVDAKNLAAKNELLLRYLAMHLMGEHTAMTDAETGEGVRKLAAAFSQKRPTPRYLLLIDGYNELPEGSIKLLNEELRNFLPGSRYESVRVVISGRTLNADLPESDFIQAEMLHLGKRTVSNYLHKELSGRDSLLKILQIPMYLKLFADTDTHGDIQNKADLLREFVFWQENKNEAAKEKQEVIAMYHILLRHMLPVIAYDMVVNRNTFVITQEDLEQIIEEATEVLYSNEYRRYYGSEYRALLKAINYTSLDSLDLADAATQYYVRVCKILHQDADGNFEFVHQVYRDFFCAWYLSESVARSLKNEACDTAISRKLFRGDIVEFVPDLLKEKTVRMNWLNYCWDHSCDETSSLVKLLALCRQADEPASAITVANIVNMIRYARQNNLSGLDLSGLDLTLTTLQDCSFFQFDRTTQYSTNFAGATINRENLFEERHYHPLRAACTNDAYIACLDEGGYLKLWKKERDPLFPEKTITNVRYAVKQMLFCPDGTKFYAVTDHEILEIPIPEETISKGQPKVLYRSAALLREIRLDSQGDLLFSTVDNTFNFKKLSDPEAADQIAFYGVNSASAINKDGTCLAYGNFIGYEGLRLYDLAEDGTWRERKFGYALLLEEFVLELEQTLRDFGQYQHFTSASADLSQRSAFFVSLQQEFMDRTHDFDEAPEKIKARCLEQMKHRQAFPDPEQMQQLDNLVKQHKKRIAAAKDKLLYLNGRKITGLQFHDDGQTLLLSGIIDYREKFRLIKRNSKNKDMPGKAKMKEGLDEERIFHSLVATIDTKTLDVHVIKIQQGKEPNRAFYCGEDILVIHKNRLRVFDKNGTRLTSIKTSSNQMKRLIAAPLTNTFYVVNDHHIYEMDTDLRCLRSFHNSLKEEKLYPLWDAYGGAYLCAKQPGKKDTDQPSYVTGPVIHLHTGVLVRSYQHRCKLLKLPNNAVTVDNRRFVLLNGSLVSFDQDQKCGEITIQQSLHICGCDFRGIRGTASDPACLQILYRMGGQTDPVTLPEVSPLQQAETFVPSTNDFVLPRGPQHKICPRNGEFTLQDECQFPNATRNKLTDRWDWEKIEKAIFIKNEWEATDYSILEWVHRLQFVTENMIRELTDAGLIATPVKHPGVGKRLMESLHKYYKVLFRARFFVDGTPGYPVVVTLNPPFGTNILQNATGQAITAPLHVLRKQKTVQVNIWGNQLMGIARRLSLNQWFTITASRHKEQLQDYAIDVVAETNCHRIGYARIQGYLRFGGQAFFGQEIRNFDSENPSAMLSDKVLRLCILAQHYQTLEAPGYQLDGMTRQPILVLIGDSLEQCRQMNQYVEFVYPNVRKLYTFDSLLLSQEAAAGAGNYLEFVDGIPHSVRLETLID